MLDLIISIKNSISDVIYSQYVNHSFWLGVLLINLICIIFLIASYFLTKKQNQKTNAGHGLKVQQQYCLLFP